MGIRKGFPNDESFSYPAIHGLLFGVVIHVTDGGYAGPKLRGSLEELGEWPLEIVKHTDKAKGFEILPRHWVVERTFAWLRRCRRLAKEWERSILSSEA